MKMQTKMRRLLIVAVASCAFSLSQAQPGDPGPDPGGSVPLDGGLSLLVAAGIGIAAKKKYDINKNQKESKTIE